MPIPIPQHVIEQCLRETETRKEAEEWLDRYRPNATMGDLIAAVNAVEAMRGSPSDYNVKAHTTESDCPIDEDTIPSAGGSSEAWADGSVFDGFADMGIELEPTGSPEAPRGAPQPPPEASAPGPEKAAENPAERSEAPEAPSTSQPEPPEPPPAPPATMPVYETVLREVRRVEWPVGTITGPEAAAKLVWFLTRDCPSERMVVVYLNTKAEVAGAEIVGQGGLSEVAVHPREVFQGALAANAHMIVVGHNHPSGSPAPSEADVETTRKIAAAGHMIGIPVLDHMIVTPSGACASIRDNHSDIFEDK